MIAENICRWVIFVVGVSRVEDNRDANHFREQQMVRVPIFSIFCPMKG
jgi:hypothetical protein